MAETELYVEAQGEGPPLVLAHGFAGSARNFRPQARALRERFRVVAYDARGHARSPAPDDPAAYRAPALAADLARVVARAGAAEGGVRDTVVGGLSMGAAVALDWALGAATPPRALVIASLPAGAGSGRGIAAQALAFADAIEREGPEAAGERFVWGPGSGFDPAGAALVRQGFLEHPPHGLIHTLREYLARLPAVEERTEALAGLALPVLVVAGERDGASLPACRALAAALPDARLEVIAEAGHVVNLEGARAFNAVLEAFLDALPPR